MYIYSSCYPHQTYYQALSYAEKHPNVEIAVWEIQYAHFSSPLYFEAHTTDTEPDTINKILEMKFSIDMFGALDDKSLCIINKVMRRIDDSNSWPICGQFNATERAIRRLRKDMWSFDSPYSYWKSLEQTISNIVNGKV